MSALAVLLGPSILFAVLALLGYSFRGRRAVLVVAVLWVGAVSAYVVASLPPAEMPVHDFERSPAPGIAATVAGTVAGAWAVVRDRGREAKAAVRGLHAAIAYTVASAVVGVATFLWIAG